MKTLNKIQNKLISIFLPLYNDEAYLKACIGSILAQSYHNFELLILDRLPTELSEKIVMSFNDSRIKYIKKQLSAQEGARYLFSIAQGEYIKLFCADDIMDRVCLQTLVTALENSGHAAVFSHMVTMSEKGKINSGDLVFSLPFNSRFDFIRYALFHRNPVLYPTVLLNKTMIKEDIFDIRFKQVFDSKMWLTLALIYKKEFAYVDQALVYYRLRQRQGNMSGGFSKNIANRLTFEQLKLIDFIVNNIQKDELISIFPDIIKYNKFSIENIDIKYIPAILNYYFLMKKTSLFYGVDIYKKYAIDKLFDLFEEEEIRNFMQENYQFNVENLKNYMSDYFKNSHVSLLDKYRKMFVFYMQSKGLKFTFKKTFYYFFR